MKTILTKYDDFFLRVAEPIIENEEYQKMKEIPHHYGSVFEHSLDVAYLAYRISQKLNLDLNSTIRGALLHDFYLFKFQKRKNRNILVEGLRHSYHHPKIALENALKHFQLNAKEVDIIVNHMFPVGLPRSYEAWVTTFADKCLAIKEYYTRLYSLIYLGMRRAILQKY